MVAKKKAANPAPRWPKGHPYAGKWAKRELFEEYQENLKRQQREQKERERKDRKNATARENRAKARAAKQQLMAKPTDHQKRVDVAHVTKGWGSTSTSRLRAGKDYAWHGAYRIQGGGEAIKKILADISPKRRPRALGDGNYEVVITPFFGFKRPGEVDDYLPEAAQGWTRDLQKMGAVDVEYLGAFYNRDRAEE